MQTRVMASLNGVSMHALDPLIIIQKITEAAPSWNVNAGSRGSLTGQRYINTEKRYREVQIAFAVREIRDLARREQALQAVAGWAAAGGVLTLSYRDGQQLRVVCSGLPAVAGINNWAENYTVTLRAYDKPYWENVAQKTRTRTGDGNVSWNLTGEGNDLTHLCCTAVNNSGSTNNLIRVIAPTGEVIRLEQLGQLNGETFVMDYDERDLLRLRIKNASNEYRSVLDKRLTTSADELFIAPAQGTVSVTSTAGVSLDWTLSVNGRWKG